MNQTSVLKELFPKFPEDVLQERQVSFMTKLKFVDYIARDIRAYQKELPHLKYDLIKSYYMEFIEHLDEEHAKRRISPFILPFRCLITIFQHLDFIDLMNYAVSSKKLFDHITSFPFFKKRLDWEKDHYQYINDKLRAGANDALPYQCMDPIEQTYKNHIILKRNLHRIRAPIPYGKTGHRYSKFSAQQAFIVYFRKKHKGTVHNNDIFREGIDLYKKLSPEKQEKYEHAALVARKYGFFFCFRNLPWYFPEEKASNTEILEAAASTDY